MESLFAIVDVFFVSRLGPVAVATVALSESIMTLVFTVGLGLSIGVTAIVARRIGEHDRDAAARATVQAIGLGVAIATLIAIVGVVAAPQLLALMGASDDVIANSSYTRVILGGNVTVLLLFLINAAFRGAGDAAVAMRVLWLANGINIFLDPMFIFGIGPFPELGVLGAGVATNIGRGTAVLAQFWLLSRPGGRLHIRREHLQLLPALMWRLVRLSGAGMFQVFISMASWVGLVRILAGFGDQVLAGYAIGIRLIMFALLPSWGMSNAAATMVGQSLGAGKPDRAERSVWIAGLYNMIFLGTIGVVFMVFAPFIVSMFTTLSDPHHWGVLCLRIVSSGFLFYAFGMVLENAFNGAGDPWTPIWINLFCFWVIELPFAWFAAHTLDWGPNGVFIAMTISFSLLPLVSGYYFRKGNWKRKLL